VSFVPNRAPVAAEGAGRVHSGESSPSSADTFKLELWHILFEPVELEGGLGCDPHYFMTNSSPKFALMGMRPTNVTRLLACDGRI